MRGVRPWFDRGQPASKGPGDRLGVIGPDGLAGFGACSGDWTHSEGGTDGVGRGSVR
jgi:hypothetical protein